MTYTNKSNITTSNKQVKGIPQFFPYMWCNVFILCYRHIKSKTKCSLICSRLCHWNFTIHFLEREKKSNNIIIHGLLEDEKNTSELLEKTKKLFLTELDISLVGFDVNKIYRIAKPNKGEKPRPTLLGLNSGWKRSEIMKNKKKLKEIYITEDYSKETVEGGKALQPKLVEERRVCLCKVR